MDNLYILSNSPGEISGWVKPTASAVALEQLNIKTTLVLLPCPYASGMEREYGVTMDGIDYCASFREAWGKDERKSIVLQLGGDPFFGAALSIKKKAPWLIYTRRPRWTSRVCHYFLPDKKDIHNFQKKKLPASCYSFVGNLMIDSVPEHITLASREEMKAKLGILQNEEAVVFLAGSRPFEYEEGFPFFIRTAMNILSKHKNLNALFPLAPTVEEKILCRGLKNEGLSWTGGDTPSEILWHGQGRIRFIRKDTYDAIKASILAVAFPGTNNLQIASLGVPLVMTAPLNYAENIPLDGIPGLIPLSFPIAKKLKRSLVMWYNARERFVSLPNRIAGKEIVPEYRLIMTPDMASDFICDTLDFPDKMRKMKELYKELPLERGAASKIAKILKNTIKNS